MARPSTRAPPPIHTPARPGASGGNVRAGSPGASAVTSPMTGVLVRRDSSSAASGRSAWAGLATHSAPTRAYPLSAWPSSASIASSSG